MKKQDAFVIYYAGLVAFTIHPGFNQPGTYTPTLAELAKTAEEMLKYTPTED